MKKLIVFIIYLLVCKISFSQTSFSKLITNCQVNKPNCDSIAHLINESQKNIFNSRNKNYFRKVSKIKKYDQLYIIESYVTDVGNNYLDILIFIDSKIIFKSYKKVKSRLKRIDISTYYISSTKKDIIGYIRQREERPCELTALNGRISIVTKIIDKECSSFLHY